MELAPDPARRLLSNLNYQFTSRLPTCQVHLRLPRPFRAEGVFLVDSLLQNTTLHKAKHLARVIERLTRSVSVVVQPNASHC